MPGPVVPPTCSDGPIWNVWLSAFHAPALAIADDLGVFPALAGGALGTEAIATKLDIDLRAAEAMLGLMTSLGFLAQVNGEFALTEVGREYLLPDSPFYWGGYLKRIRDVPLDCKKLTAALRRGRTMEGQRVSSELWRKPAPPPEALISFTHAMHAHSFGLAMRIAAALPLDGVSRLLDVGGGSGSYSIAAMLRTPGLQCTELDLPVVCEVAKDYARNLGVGERFGIAPADMFAGAWPGGYERVLFSDIFHDWDDERCRQLAGFAFEALEPGGRVLLHEMILADTKTGPLAAAGYSMVMAFVTEGRQRTPRELFELLLGAGFVRPRLTMTAEGYALVEAERP